MGQAGFWSQPPPSATWLTDQSLPHSAPSLRVLICEMGRLSCLPLCAAVRIKQDGVDGAAGTDFMVVTVELPHPTWATLVVTVPQPWSQGFWEGDSASLLAQPAWPLTFSTQAVKAACLPAGGGGRAEGSASQLLAGCCPPPLPLLSLTAPVCELINLSPFGKLERRSRPRPPQPRSASASAGPCQDPL